MGTKYDPLTGEFEEENIHDIMKDLAKMESSANASLVRSNEQDFFKKDKAYDETYDKTMMNKGYYPKYESRFPFSEDPSSIETSCASSVANEAVRKNTLDSFLKNINDVKTDKEVYDKAFEDEMEKRGFHKTY